MNKELKRYYTTTKAALNEMTPAEAHDFFQYHRQRVQEFQHERIVHLLVTLFFGALLVVSVVALFVVDVRTPSMLIQALLSGVTLLLLVTELCYVWYYYLLENGVQKLYTLTALLQVKATE